MSAVFIDCHRNSIVRPRDVRVVLLQTLAVDPVIRRNAATSCPKVCGRRIAVIVCPPHEIRRRAQSGIALHRGSADGAIHASHLCWRIVQLVDPPLNEGIGSRLACRRRCLQVIHQCRTLGAVRHLERAGHGLPRAAGFVPPLLVGHARVRTEPVRVSRAWWLWAYPDEFELPSLGCHIVQPLSTEVGLCAAHRGTPDVYAGPPIWSLRPEGRHLAFTRVLTPVEGMTFTNDRTTRERACCRSRHEGKEGLDGEYQRKCPDPMSSHQPREMSETCRHFDPSP